MLDESVLPLCVLASAIMAVALDARAAGAERPTIAVFPIQGEVKQLSPKTLDSLTDYLLARLANTYQVIPRNEIRSLLQAEKKASYKSCVDESCQIEIGKELAAQKTLQTKVSRVGKTCIYTSILFDLARAASERSATAESDCTEDGAIEALKGIAEQLTREGGAPPTKVPEPPAWSLDRTFQIRSGAREDGASLKDAGTVQFFRQGPFYGFVRNTKGAPPLSGIAIDGEDIVATTWGAGGYGVAIYTVNGGVLRQVRDAGASTGVADTGDVVLTGAPGLSGSYALNSSFRDGARWTGTVDITKVGAEKYRVQFNVGTNSWPNVGILMGDKLVISWGVEGQGGVGVYAKKGGRLEGRWASFDFSRKTTSQEILSP